MIYNLWRCIKTSFPAVICLLLASATAASEFPIWRLHKPLGPDETLSGFRITPDQARVVFSIAEIAERSPSGGVRFGAQSVYSAPISGGLPVRLNDPSLGVRVPTGAGLFVTGDSQSVVFMSRGKQDNFDSIFLTPIDGGDLVRLSGPDSPRLFRTLGSLFLTEDDSRVLFTSDGDIISLPLNGNGHVVLNPPLLPGDRIPHLVFPTASSRMLFTLYRQSQSRTDLWSVMPDGTNLVRLSASLPNGGGGVRGINNSLVLFHSLEGDLFSHTNGLFIVPQDGSSLPTQLLADSINARFAPNGQQVVFDQFSDIGISGLFSIPATGGAPVQVTAPLEDGERISQYDFTADSQSILYSVYGKIPRLYRASLDGSEVVQLNAPTAANGGFVSSVTLSPDGTTVAYIDDPNADGIRDLFLVSLDGGVPVQVTDSSSNSIDIRVVEFSPDGQRLAFHSETRIDNFFAPFLVRVDSDRDDFGVSEFRPIDISITSSETNRFRFIDDQLGLIFVGSSFSTEAFAILIPEPSSVVLAIWGCLWAISRRR